MSQEPSETPDCEAIVDSSLGQELEKGECEILATVMRVRHLKDDEILVKEGDADHTLFILTKGKLKVNSKIEGKDMTVYTMKVGECAGTRAFVDLAPRSATLQAVGDTAVYTLEPKDFESLLEEHPRIVYKVMRGLFRLTHKNLMRMNVESQALSNYIHKTGGRY
ncbi:MAG: Crp/Fnr family transcriptional regulator [Gammaproteobacteria bacterium SG8_11]|nr:MAG: Crp/Fnr family transcriptional regulator [Gammaproteobacteria bacterium SG8_11]